MFSLSFIKNQRKYLKNIFQLKRYAKNKYIGARYKKAIKFRHARFSSSRVRRKKNLHGRKFKQLIVIIRKKIAKMYIKKCVAYPQEDFLFSYLQFCMVTPESHKKLQK
jgi:hypothetical protein